MTKMTKPMVDYTKVLKEMLGRHIEGITMISDTEIWFEVNEVSYKVSMKSVNDYINSEKYDEDEDEFKYDPVELYRQEAKLLKKIDDRIKKLNLKRELLKKEIELSVEDGDDVRHKVGVVEDFLEYANKRFTEGKGLIENFYWE